jgi:hypothetical protein
MPSTVSSSALACIHLSEVHKAAQQLSLHREITSQFPLLLKRKPIVLLREEKY